MARKYGSAGTTRSFSRSVNKWALEMEERSEQAFQNAALDFYDEMARQTPVDTGNLRNSLIASVNGPSAATVTGPGANSGDSTFRSGASTSIANIMSAKIGDKISFVYMATYARRLNYGFVGTDSLGRTFNQAGRFWIERVGSQWRSISRRAATRLKMAMK